MKRSEKKFTFSSLFEVGKVGVVTIMATFLAMLELTRLKRLKVSQDERFGEIYCEKIEIPEEPQYTGEISDTDDEEVSNSEE